MAEFPKSNEQVARAWCAVTISKWRGNLKTMAIGASGQLRSSFRAVVAGGGDVTSIRLSYSYHGKYVDQGVGRGTKLSGGKPVRVSGAGRQLRGKGKRVPKRWYSDTIGKETHILSQILTANTGAYVSASFNQNIPGQIRVEF